MTRINCVPVGELTQQHLVAEYREMLRIRANVKRWLTAKKPSVIPETYRMGKGHVAFFYNKLIYINNRHEQLRNEMRNRGYKVNCILDVSELPKHLHNDWTPTVESLAINRNRIQNRLNK